MKYNYTKAYSERGSNIGRSNIFNEPNCIGPFYLQRVPLDRGAYDPGGAYWGHAEHLYVAFAEGAEERQEVFVRAWNREEAKDEVKRFFRKAEFWR